MRLCAIRALYWRGFASLLLAAGLLGYGTVEADGPPVQWQKTFDSVAGQDFGYSVQQTADGGYIIAGKTTCSACGDSNVYLIKTDPNGNKKWQKTFGGSNDDVGYSVQQTADGGYIIAGYTESFGSGAEDVYLIKTDPTGNLIWQKTFGGSYYDYGYSVQQTTDGGYIIAGTTYSPGAFFVYLIKTDPNGNREWQKTFGGGIFDTGWSVHQTSDGGYIIAGHVTSFGAGRFDVYLVKTDSNGNKKWQTTFGGSNRDMGYSVQQTADGGYIIAGRTESFGAGMADVYLVKTDSNGNKEWQTTFGGSNDDVGYSVQQTADEGYIIAGGTTSFGTGNIDGYLIKTDSAGNSQWQKTFEVHSPEYKFSVHQTSDGGYIIAGSTAFNDGDVYLIKLAPEVGMTCSLESTEFIFSQIEGGFGRLPNEWVRGWEVPIPDKDSPAGNYIFTSTGGLESITLAGELPGKPIPVLGQMSALGNGQPQIDYVSTVPYYGDLHNWLTKPRGPQDDPAPQDLRQRSLLTGVNAKIKIDDFTSRDSVNLVARFETYGWAEGYGLGTTASAVTHALMDSIMVVAGTQISFFEKLVYKITFWFTGVVAPDDAIGYDARFRAKAEASACFGEPINRCFDCPAITPDGIQSYLWQGGGISKINSGLVWQGVDFQVTVPTNQEIPLLLELATSAETAGSAWGGADILLYRLSLTCPEIPGFGTYVIDSYDYPHRASLEAASGQAQANGQGARPQGMSFREVLAGAAGSEYLRTGLVSAKESVAGVRSPTSYPFAFVEGTEQSGLMFPVGIPRKPQKLVLLFDMFAEHAVTPDEPIIIEFGLISTQAILLTKTIEASEFTYKAVPEPNEGYLVHTDWQEIVVDISDMPSSATMFCIAVDANQASLNFALAQSDLLIISEPALAGDFNADAIVNLIDYAILTGYWLEEDCNYPEWCGATDMDLTGRVDFTELATICSNWLRERIASDFEPDGDVDFSDLMELANYWLSAESSLDMVPPGGNGRIDFRDFADLAKHWLEGTTP